MHTTLFPIPNPTHNTRIREAQEEADLVMLRVQTKALETLEALMDEPKQTGDAKKDAVTARERNRRRLAATQALTHIRAVQRAAHTAAKVRAKTAKPTAEPPESPRVPLAACRPVQGREKRPKDAAPPKPKKPAPPSDSSALNTPDTLTGQSLTPDLQQDWLRERKQAMAKARSKRKAQRR